MERREDLRIARLVLRFPPFARYQRVQEGFEVEVKNPLKDESPWSLFLLCLWKREEVQEHDKVVVVRIPLWKVSAYLGNEDSNDLKKTLLALRELTYYYRDRERKVVFGVLNSAVIEKGYIELEIPYAFWQECKERDWRLLAPFVPFIRGKYELSLFTFLSTDIGREVSYREDVLFEKAGMKETMPASVKRFKLKKVLEKLIALGFLSSYHYEKNTVRIKFPSMDALRIRATEYSRLLEEKAHRVIERKKEHVRRYRERKRKTEHPVNLDF